MELIFMRLHVNLASLNIFNEQTKNLKLQSKSMERISSGVKVNTSSDNPDAMAQSEKFRMQIRGLQMAQRNTQDGVSLLQNAEGSLDSITSMVQRIRELAVQAGGVTTPGDMTIIQNEINQMKSGIDLTVSSNEFNGLKLINDSTVTDNNSPSFTTALVGANTGDTVNIPKYNLNSATLGGPALGMALKDIDVTQPGGVDKALTIADNVMLTLSSVRGNYGALENRFQSTYDRTGALEESAQTADSGIRDTDIASEMVEFSRTGILIEAANALMVQTNKFPQDMLKILDNVR
jgi:flagellin